MTQQTKQVFLFLAHYGSKSIIKEYEKIIDASRDLGNTVWLYHNHSEEIPLWIKKYSYYSFSDTSIKSLDYPMIGNSLIPGHAHFPVFQFFLENEDYDYYWLIEYDVRFSGDWHLFFNSFHNNDNDLLASHIRRYAEEPDWNWWKLTHPDKSIAIENRLRSFAPVYRISKSALSFINNAMKSGWCGHCETLIPTLLHHNGFKLLDFGGNGEFTSQDMVDNFYTYPNTDQYGSLRSGTMRFRPSFWKVGNEKNKLYHPVKSLWKVIRERLTYFPKRFYNNLRYYIKPILSQILNLKK